MKSIISKTLGLTITLAALFAFSSMPGGEGFEISLNNKVVLQQYGKDLNTVKSLELGNLSASDKLTIRYHHCGRVGKNRIVTIKDGSNNLVKEFRFADASAPVSDMVIYVKDILNVKKANTGSLKIYYTSSELPGGRQLANIRTGSDVAVR